MEKVILTHGEYMTLVEQSPIMIWRADTTKLCNYFNNRWLAFTGRTMQQEMGNGWTEGVHPDDFDRCLEIYTTFFDKEEIFEMEYRLMRHDGVYRWLFDRGVPFYSGSGTFAGYIGSCTDITENVEARELLYRKQQSEIKELRKLLPICASCKNIRDDEGYWNRIENYFENKSAVEFSHSICPDCMEKLYPDLSDSE
ncbi:MAG: PAS domain-containing protein [Fibrobacterota bacterium]